MTADNEGTGPSAHGRAPAMRDESKEQLVDYLIALSEALWIPPAGTDGGEPIYYDLIADRLEAVVDTLRVTLQDGLSRTLPDQTARLHARIAELPTTTYQYVSENWSSKPAQPRPQATGEQLQELASDFLTVLLELLDVPASGGEPRHPWLLEDRVVTADIAMTIIISDDLNRSLSEGAAYLRDQIGELRKGRY